MAELGIDRARGLIIRHLRRLGYVVIAPDEVDAVDDELSGHTCGCNTMGVERAHAAAVDPRPIVPWKLSDAPGGLIRRLEIMGTPSAELGPPFRRRTQ